MKASSRNPFILGALIASLSLVPAGRVGAQALTTLHNFTGTDGDEPMAGLLLSSNILYGTTVYSGTGGFFGLNGYGTVFEINTSGTGFTNLHKFNGGGGGGGFGGGGDTGGQYPYAGLVSSGNILYGTTWEGGKDGYGTVFAIKSDGTGYTNLHSFTYGSDGGYPYAGLILSGTNLYGTTEYGGNSGGGVVFSIGTNGGAVTTLHGFTGGADGAYPYAGLILSGSNLFGTTSEGGSQGYGNVFMVATNGGGFTNLHNFNYNSDGGYPYGSLILSGATLFGTTYEGGLYGAGTVFAINTNGTGFTNLYTFTDGNDGGYPQAGLILSDATLYGTASEGGTNGAGSVFSLYTNGSGFTNLYSFTDGDDGGYPASGLVLSGNTLYGTAEEGGIYGDGTVFSLNVLGAVGVQFTASPTAGVLPLTVNFTAPSMDTQSNAIVSWNWTFGDGGTSTLQNPTNTYLVAGTYSPTLQVTNINGLMIVATGPSIVVSAPPPTLAFTASPTSGVISLAVNFSSPGADDEGNAITNWSWTFGDGGTSAGQSPSHTYTASGDFNPSLTAVNANGSVIAATGPSIPVYPAMIASTANPVVGAVPLTVKFAAATVDLAGNPITGWHWVFGDGTTSAAQSPSHIYTNEGAFSPTLMATNSIGTAVAGYGPASITATNVAAYSGLVQNGGFETGDFTGWALASAASNTLNTFVDNGSQSEIVPHSGKNLAASGSLGSLSYLSQTLATSKGAPYLLSLWLNSPDGRSPNQFLVSWNGTTLFNETNVPSTGWTNLQFLVSATGTGTVLKFGFRNDPSYLGLDDVSVVPAQTGIGSFNVSGANLVLNGTNGLAGQTYYVMMSTNLALPLSQWTNVATNVLSASGNFTLSVNKPATSGASQQFYIVQLQ